MNTTRLKPLYPICFAITVHLESQNSFTGSFACRMGNYFWFTGHLGELKLATLWISIAYCLMYAKLYYSVHETCVSCMNQIKVATQNIDYLPTICRYMYLLLHVEFVPRKHCKIHTICNVWGHDCWLYTCQIFRVCDLYFEHVCFRITGVWGGFPWLM